MRDGRAWRVVRLGDHCAKIGSGATPRGGEAVYQERGVALIRSQNVYNGQFAMDGLAHLDEEHADQLNGVTVKSGDVLLNITGDSVARSCRVSEEVLPARVNQHVAIIRPKPAEFDSRFVGYYLISPFMQDTMLSLARSGGTRNALTKQMIERFEVPRPPRPVQVRIADILSAYDDLIENNRRRMALLEEAARQLYREWFVRLRFPGHQHTPITNGLPKGWQRIHLADACRTQYGYTETATTEPVGPRFLRGMDINKTDFIDWSTVPYCEIDEPNQRKYHLRIGDIVVIRMADPGKVGIVERDIDAVFASYLIRLEITNSRVAPYYLYYVLSDYEYQQFVSGAGAGSTRKTASAPLLVDFYFLLPTKPILRAFGLRIGPLRKQITTLLIQNEKLRAARDLLLPRLMNGEVGL
ncbi:MAG: restriction endonuclease subunit S [Gammaproteobacteria bacterium]